MYNFYEGWQFSQSGTFVFVARKKLLEAGKVAAAQDWGALTNGSRADVLGYFHRLHALTHARNASLVLVGDSPEFHCLPLPPKYAQCVDGHPLWEDLNGGIMTGLARLPGVYYFDASEPFCHGDRCNNWVTGPTPGTVADVMGFIDNSHMAAAGAFSMWPHLCRFFAANELLGP